MLKLAKKNRNRKGKSGWAHTKWFPHASHPATYYRKSPSDDSVEYITFTHSEEVDLGDKGKVRTVPLLDNISPAERAKNKREGKDTSITRTARLFYVACTRAQKSLAVVAYTANVESVKNTALSNGWFSEDEIYIL